MFTLFTSGVLTESLAVALNSISRSPIWILKFYTSRPRLSRYKTWCGRITFYFPVTGSVGLNPGCCMQNILAFILSFRNALWTSRASTGLLGCSKWAPMKSLDSRVDIRVQIWTAKHALDTSSAIAPQRKMARLGRQRLHVNRNEKAGHDK